MLRMLSARNKVLILRILAFLLVMLVGALLFLATEGRRSIKEAKVEDKNYQLIYNISKDDYDLLLESVRNDTYFPGTVKLPWTFGNSLYFVIVLITTIGYGHLSPETWQGQIFCIFFSLIAIPVTALVLKSVGEFITKAINAILFAFEEKVLRNDEPRNLERKCFIVTLVLMVAMLLSGAAVTRASEGWTMMQGVYFTFVTLTTIGFGDYVVNDGAYVHKDLARTVVTQINLIFLLLGLGVVSSVLCSISQLLESGGLSCCRRKDGVESTEKNETVQGKEAGMTNIDL